MSDDIRAVSELIEQESAFVDVLMDEIHKVIVGQKQMVERLLLGMLCDGHVLLEGVPGLAKTLTVTSLAHAMDASFKRIQFTPDLLPSDVTGTMIWDPERRVFEPKQGPIFANIVLADEINRAPAKVQSALLEAMQERQVTLGDTTFALPKPFLVLATQNPIEQEGTYPLPEAQVDRFMLYVKVDYPSKSEERLVMDRMTEASAVQIEARVTPEHIQRAKDAVRKVYIDDKIKDYIIDLVQATRHPAQYGLTDLEPLLRYGASPRASIALNLAARAQAFLRHRAFVSPDDVKSVGHDVLRHRMILSFEAEAEEVSQDNVVQRIFDKVVVP